MINNKSLLIVAYAFQPNRGSEHEVGFRWSVMIAEAVKDYGYTVYVLTRTKKKKFIEEVKDKLPDNLKFIYFDFPPKLLFWKKGSLTVLLYYNLWQIGAFLKLKLSRNKIDPEIIHHLTFVNDYLPSYFAFFSKKAKFIWGPVASNFPYPCSLTFSWKICLLDRIKIISKSFVRNINPLFYLAMRKADYLIVPTPRVAERFKKKPWKVKKIVILPQSAGIKIPAMKQPEEKKKFTVLYAGQLIYLKNPHLVIDAFTYFIDKYNPDAELIFIGEGPLRDMVYRKIKENPSKEKIAFLNRMPRDKFLEILAKSSVLLFPTTEEVGMVIFEAMSLGVPVITTECAGLSFIIENGKNGFKVGCNDYQKSIVEVGDILVQLYNNRKLLDEVSDRAKSTFEKNFAGDKVIETLKKVYFDE